MLEESISCSPGNNAKKSRSRRFHKNRKKKREPHNETSARNLLNLESLYEEPTSPGILNRTSLLEFCNPFENEKLLAAADRAEAASTSDRKLQNVVSQGFIPLEILKTKEVNETTSVNLPECSTSCSSFTPKSPHALGLETQFGITESEFVQFCDDAESDIIVQSINFDVIPKNSNRTTGIKNETDTKRDQKPKSVVEEILRDFCGSSTESEIEEQTPPNSVHKNLKKTRTIVDDILEDFCGSPSLEKSPKPSLDDSTPVFQFKSHPIRTYSRVRKKKLFQQDATTDFNDFLDKEDGNTSDDSSSGLSVQEDLSQSIVPQLDTVDLNNSVKLCENLLNLSSYFSQLTSSSPSCKNKNLPSDNDKRKDTRISAIIEEIIKIKSKCLRIHWNTSEDEFFGFSDYESDSNESTLHELLEYEDDVLQQINCDSLCLEKAETKVPLTNKDLEDTLQYASIVIEQAKALLSDESDVKHEVDNSVKNYQPDCDIDKDSITKPSSFKDEQLFDDLDIWNDNECLLNYKTQKTSTNNNEYEDNDIRNVDKKTNCGSKAIKCDTKSEGRSYCHQLDSFKKPKQFPEPYSSVFVGNAFNENQAHCSTSTTLLNSNCVGFATANKKPILISDIAKERANQFLQEFEQEELKKKDITDFASITNVSKHSTRSKTPLNENVNSNCVGFATASKKPILISDVAKEKANQFLQEFEQEELKKKDIKDFSSTKSVSNDSARSKTPPNTSSNQKGEIMKQNEKDDHKKMIEAMDCKENKADQRDNSSGITGLTNQLNNNIGFAGFSTASKKLISISDTAKQRANAILKEFEEEEQQKRSPKTQYKPPLENNIVKDRAGNCDFLGFSTASEKPIAISLEAKRKADLFLKEFEQAEELNAPTERLTQRHPIEVSEEVRQKAQDLLSDIEFFEGAFEEELKEIEASQIVGDNQRITENTGISSKRNVCFETTNKQVVEGFKTASKKSIQISEEASRRAKTFFNAICDEDLPQEFLKCIESDINDTKSTSNLMLREEEVDGAIKSRRSDRLHGVLKTKSEHVLVTNGFDKESQFPCQATKERSIVDQTTDFKKKEDSLNKANNKCQDFDRNENMKHRKRKHSQELDIEKSFSLDENTTRRLSCGERTPLNHQIKNGLLSKSNSMPLKESTSNSGLISRKNLLSLSKRKKIESPIQVPESKVQPKTPGKGEQSSICQHNSNSTPNLKDFFDSVSTSTPRLIRNLPSNNNKQIQNTSKDAIDSDFRVIQWEELNNSFRINRTGCADDVNVTFSQVSPSPKQRIDVLKMYGEPPAISPISMLNKCRPSGLRRGRSLMKP